MTVSLPFVTSQHSNLDLTSVTFRCLKLDMQQIAEGLQCLFVILFVGTLREAEPVGDSVKDRVMLSILAGEDSI